MENIMRIAEKLDVEKFDVYRKGYSFIFVVQDKKGEFTNVGIGDGEEMTMLNLVALDSLYNTGAREDVPFEAYAESVKENLIKFHNMRTQETYDAIDLKPINTTCGTCKYNNGRYCAKIESPFFAAGVLDYEFCKEWQGRSKE